MPCIVAVSQFWIGHLELGNREYSQDHVIEFKVTQTGPEQNNKKGSATKKKQGKQGKQGGGKGNNTRIKTCKKKKEEKKKGKKKKGKKKKAKKPSPKKSKNWKPNNNTPKKTHQNALTRQTGHTSCASSVLSCLLVMCHLASLGA